MLLTREQGTKGSPVITDMRQECRLGRGTAYLQVDLSLRVQVEARAAEGPDIRAVAKAQEAQDAPRPEGFLKTVFRMIWEEIVRSFVNRLVQALLGR